MSLLVSSRYLSIELVVSYLHAGHNFSLRVRMERVLRRGPHRSKGCSERQEEITLAFLAACRGQPVGWAQIKLWVGDVQYNPPFFWLF